MKRYIKSAEVSSELPNYFVWDNAGYHDRYSVHVKEKGICIRKISPDETNYVYAWWFTDGTVRYQKNFGGRFINTTDIRIVKTEYEDFDWDDVTGIYEFIDHICDELIQLNKGIKQKLASPY